MDRASWAVYESARSFRKFGFRPYTLQTHIAASMLCKLSSLGDSQEGKSKVLGSGAHASVAITASSTST